MIGNSVNPDERQNSVASHQGLHCFVSVFHTFHLREVWSGVVVDCINS